MLIVALMWWLGPWQWSDFPIPSWNPPPGARAVLDLRPLGGVFCSDASLDSSYVQLGIGAPAEIRPKPAAREALGHPAGDSLADMLFDVLTNKSDPAGETAPHPLMPSRRLDLVLLLGQFQHVEKTGEGKHHWQKITDLWQRSMGPMIEAELNRGSEQHRRVLGGLCDKYKTQNWRQFVPPQLRGEVPGPLPKASTFNESFDTANQVGLGPDLTWTSITGTWEVKTNAATKTATASTSEMARADHALSDPDSYAQCVQVSSAANDFHGPAIRMPSTAVTEGFCCANFGGLNFLISMGAGGSQANLASSPYTLVLNDVFKIEANGSTIRTLVNGVQTNSVTDTNYPANVRGGLLMFAASTSPHMDSFKTSDVLTGNRRRRLLCGAAA